MYCIWISWEQTSTTALWHRFCNVFILGCFLKENLIESSTALLDTLLFLSHVARVLHAKGAWKISVYSMHFYIKMLMDMFSSWCFLSFVDHTKGKKLPRLITQTASEKNLAAWTTMLCNSGGLTSNFSKGYCKGRADCSFTVWKVSREIPESRKIHWDCFSGFVSALHLVYKATAAMSLLFGVKLLPSTLVMQRNFCTANI